MTSDCTGVSCPRALKLKGGTMDERDGVERISNTCENAFSKSAAGCEKIERAV